MIMHGGLTRIREEAKTGGSGDTTSQLLACPIVHDWEDILDGYQQSVDIKSKVAQGQLGINGRYDPYF